MKPSLRARLYAVFLSALPVAALAQSASLIPDESKLGPGCSFVTGIFGFQCIPLYLAYLIQLAFSFAGGLALIEILLAGYEIALAGVRGTDTSGPRNRILYAVGGLAFCIFSFLIIDTIIFALAR
ncbi:MAG: hypothetical protein JWM56_586 [Candidatus Peribacteria bacterium]|nr:hypothetical protein [Candidatus Peribacteria bacterium]